MIKKKVLAYIFLIAVMASTVCSIMVPIYDTPPRPSYTNSQPEYQANRQNGYYNAAYSPSGGYNIKEKDNRDHFAPPDSDESFGGESSDIHPYPYHHALYY